MNDTAKIQNNPLGTAPVGTLLRQFAIPSIVAMLVSSLYNMVDQLFIGNSVGELGNAATNIAFPLNTLCIALALLFGIGAASAFNLAMGSGNTKHAAQYIGNAITVMAAGGILIAIITLLFLEPILVFCGSPDNVLPYAKEYTGIVALGFPFLLLSAAGGHIVRADGSPNMTMAINLSGAIVNVILDYLFVMRFGWGMAGAATATVIGQVIATGIVFWYLPRFKTVKLDLTSFIPRLDVVARVASLGTAACFNQISIMVVQVMMNKTLKHYGALSVYGESIPIACSGIIAKVTMVVFAFVLGISQGLQPIVSFNYGAGQYDRVKKGYFLAIKVAACITITSYIFFQLFPRQIIGVFGTGSELYFQFAENYFHIYLAFLWLCFFQPITANYFTAIGKPKMGIFMSLTRQIIFYLPLLVVLPMIFGIDGVMYSCPIADVVASTVCAVLMYKELKRPEYKM